MYIKRRTAATASSTSTIEITRPIISPLLPLSPLLFEAPVFVPVGVVVVIEVGVVVTVAVVVTVGEGVTVGVVATVGVGASPLTARLLLPPEVLLASRPLEVKALTT